jgi:hypothetical protein
VTSEGQAEIEKKQSAKEADKRAVLVRGKTGYSCVRDVAYMNAQTFKLAIHEVHGWRHGETSVGQGQREGGLLL